MRTHPHPLRMGHADNGAVVIGCRDGGGCEEENSCKKSLRDVIFQINLDNPWIVDTFIKASPNHPILVKLSS